MRVDGALYSWGAMRDGAGALSAGLLASAPSGLSIDTVTDKLTTAGLLAAVVYFLMSVIRGLTAAQREDTAALRQVIEANTAILARVVDRLDCEGDR